MVSTVESVLPRLSLTTRVTTMSSGTIPLVISRPSNAEPLGLAVIVAAFGAFVSHVLVEMLPVLRLLNSIMLISSECTHDESTNHRCVKLALICAARSNGRHEIVKKITRKKENFIGLRICFELFTITISATHFIGIGA